MNVLALTVGGACAPIVAAIRDYSPDYVCFFATSGPRGSRSAVDGPGDPCGDKRTTQCPDCGAAVPLGDPRGANIVTQTGLSESQYCIQELDEPDVLDYCYRIIRQALRDLAAKHANARLIADYTGGTKTMSIALALAAIEADWELSLVKGQRPDLVRVADGTEIAGLVNAWEVQARQSVAEARRLFNDYAYASASELLSSLQRRSPLGTTLQRTVQEWVAYCRGYDAWDRFDHSRAVQILSTVPGQNIAWPFLKTLAGQTRASGYEPVADLVLNAERRAARGRFDDAVARLYRALELLAQTRLKQRQPPLNCSDLDPEALPETIRPRYLGMREISEMQGQGPQIKLGLLESYLLLEALDDPLGRVFVDHKQKLLDVLQKRNHSILAHGLTPLGQADYDRMRDIAGVFLRAGLAALDVRWNASQFPILTDKGLEAR
jgi:CRISPR-associated protein (TIGR02710 family)